MKPTIHSRIHLLADRTAIRFHAGVYPRLEIVAEADLKVDEMEMIVTLTGDRLDQQTFAQQLREVADSIENWQPEAPAPEEGDVIAAKAVPA